MYICDKTLKQAIDRIEDHKNPTICHSEEKDFPFVWYVWGDDDKKLNPYKKKIWCIKYGYTFFLHTKTEEVISRIPSENEPARHPQGMKHDLVISYISEMLISIVETTSSQGNLIQGNKSTLHR